MWPFQEEMLHLFANNRFVITKCPRQVGKTTTTVAYMLWATIFTDTQNCAVLANKGSLARDILSKYYIYNDEQKDLTKIALELKKLFPKTCHY
jgi:hypothetical protein